MDALEVKAVPAQPASVLTITVQILLPIVAEHIVLAGYIESPAYLGALQHFIDCVEFLGFGEMREVARVNQQLGSLEQSVDPVYGGFQSADHVLVRFLGETDVAVADLNEREIVFFGLAGILTEYAGGQDPSTYGPSDACAYPGHALQKAAAVDAVVVMIVNNSSGHEKPLS